ncbi:HTH-type transcriptional repressor NsrR [Oceaniferula spumae]|uniref:HTH-type transcriptional repressor NsrR n=1 Tax=Oceaniferula spumae TaxID=2979115 RepID=A0AAT9FS46_9BACT
MKMAASFSHRCLSKLNKHVTYPFKEMRITYYTDYAFRLLIYMLIHRDETVSTRAVAESYGISVNHLNKVCQRLVQMELLTARRGRGGGITLTEAAVDWKLGDLVKELEPDGEIAQCNGGQHDAPCTISPACHLRSLLGQAQNAFFDSLNQHKVGNLLDKNSDSIRKLLS